MIFIENTSIVLLEFRMVTELFEMHTRTKEDFRLFLNALLSESEIEKIKYEGCKWVNA